MSQDVARNLGESKKKIAAVAKNQKHPDSPAVSRFRNTPNGRRMAELRKRKLAKE